MIKNLIKTIAIVGVLSSLTGCITVQMGAQQRQAQPAEGYAQPINYGGKQQQGQQQQNGGCAPGSRRIGTNPNGGAHCQWDSPQQGQQPTQDRRYHPQQQGQQQQQQKNCNGAGYRDLTTGRFIPAC